METLKADIKAVLIHEMEVRNIGQEKLARQLCVGVRVINDLFNLKRAPTALEVERLDVALQRGGAWVKKFKDATRKPRKTSGADLRRARFYSLADYAKGVSCR